MQMGKPVYRSASGFTMAYDGTRWLVSSGTGEIVIRGAIADQYCPQSTANEAWEVVTGNGWATYPLMVECACPCEAISVLSRGISYHSVGDSNGAHVYLKTPGVRGDEQRPIFTDYGGEYLIYDSAARRWYTDNDDVNTGSSYLFTTDGGSGADHFCPSSVPENLWSRSIYTPDAYNVSISCTCACYDYVDDTARVLISGAESAQPGSMGVYERPQPTNNIVWKDADGRNILFNSVLQRYLFYWGPDLRWIVAPQTNSDAGATVRSQRTSSFCPTSLTSGWETLKDGEWAARNTRVMCYSRDAAPPAPPASYLPPIISPVTSLPPPPSPPPSPSLPPPPSPPPSPSPSPPPFTCDAPPTDVIADGSSAYCAYCLSCSAYCPRCGN